MRVKLKISASARASTSLRLGALSCVRVRMIASMGVGCTLSAPQTSFRCPKSKSTNWTSGTVRTASSAVGSTKRPPNQNQTKPRKMQSPSTLSLPMKIVAKFNCKTSSCRSNHLKCKISRSPAVGNIRPRISIFSRVWLYKICLNNRHHKWLHQMWRLVSRFSIS